LKRLSTGVLAALLVAGLGLNAVAAPSNATSHGNIGTNAMLADDNGSASAPPANFGSPPSGQYPILYNYHHVYAKPDTLRKGRVLAALVRGGTILIPLRSMFEQMGATVKYDPATKTVDVSKPGADIKVTVGKPEVVINGETRPLDVPPMIYKGVILVPVRVLSEAMGAYVKWVDSAHEVSIRYIPPTPPPPPPTPAPTEAPTPAPTPTPAPIATPYKDLFIVGDFINAPKVYNEFSPGNTGSNSSGGFSYALRGATEFNAASLPWMFEADYRQFNYPYTGTTVITIGGAGTYTFAPQTMRDYDFDARLGLKVLEPRIYIGVGYMTRNNNAGYPTLRGVGFGVEKLPDLDKVLSLYGSFWDYPNVKGTYAPPGAPSYQLQENVYKYQLGLTYVLPGTPVFFEGGLLGDRGFYKLNAPGPGFSENGGYIGLGIKF
jgi:hypothetical protein